MNRTQLKIFYVSYSSRDTGRVNTRNVFPGLYCRGHAVVSFVFCNYVTVMHLSNFCPTSPMRAREGFDLQRNLCLLGLSKIIFLIPSFPRARIQEFNTEFYNISSNEFHIKKKLKIKKVSRDCAIKSKETRIRLWDKRTFWA